MNWIIASAHTNIAFACEWALLWIESGRYFISSQTVYLVYLSGQFMIELCQSFRRKFLGGFSYSSHNAFYCFWTWLAPCFFWDDLFPCVSPDELWPSFDYSKPLILGKFQRVPPLKNVQNWRFFDYFHDLSFENKGYLSFRNFFWKNTTFFDP